MFGFCFTCLYISKIIKKVVMVTNGPNETYKLQQLLSLEIIFRSMYTSVLINHCQIVYVHTEIST